MSEMVLHSITKGLLLSRSFSTASWKVGEVLLIKRLPQKYRNREAVSDMHKLCRSTP